MQETLEQLERMAGTERRVVMATLLGTRGATPRRAGARMWVGEAGRLLGSVTIGGCVDARVIEETPDILASGARLLALPLGDEDAWDVGMACAGTVDVLVE